MFSKPKLLTKHLRSLIVDSKLQHISSASQVIFSKNDIFRRCFSEFPTYSPSTNKELNQLKTEETNQKLITKPFTVIVEGNVGSGKTTFLNRFMQNSNVNRSNTLPEHVEVVPEPVSKWQNLHGSNLLQLMYEDPKRWSLMFQSYVHLTMVQQHTNIQSTKPIRMMERSLFSARYCFNENLYRNGYLTDTEYAALSEWFDFLINCPKLNFQVDQIVYLRTSPDVAYERIKKRSRSEETSVPFSYIKDLHELHENWLIRQTKFNPPAPVTIIDANQDLETLSETYNDQGRKLLNQAKNKIFENVSIIRNVFV